MTKSKPENRILRWIEKTLLVVGLVGLGMWLGSSVLPVIWQSWDNWVFDREAQGETASLTGYLTEEQRRITSAVAVWLGFSAAPESGSSQIQPAQNQSAQNQPARPSVLENNALIGRLTIPRLHVNTTVREGSGEVTLALAAGHIRGTALPGENGNVAVAGHRDTLFRALRGIRNDDLIQFETLRGRYEYRVASIAIVPPQQVSVLRARSYSELTLVTCYPFDYLGSAPDRFIVKARQVSTAPIERNFTEANVEPAGTRPGSPFPAADAGKTFFSISARHSRQLAPGISLGVDETDADGGQIKGWLWVMPDRRTIWLQDQPARQPLIFYQDGEKRELLITNVTNGSAQGYLRLPETPVAH